MPNRVRATGRAGGPLFVDSGAWIAVASASDGHHAEADRLLREAVTRRLSLITTNLIVAECHRWLVHRFGSRPAGAFLQRLDTSRMLRVEFATAEHHRGAREWLDRLADQRITYTDAVSFAVIRSARCTAAITFDRDFTLAGFPVWQPG